MNSRDIFDWQGYEETLTLALEEAVFRFGYQNTHTQCYALCIDCNPRTAEVLLHLNDENEHYKQFKLDKWNISEWKYFNVIENLQDDDQFFDNAWKDVQQHIKKHMLPVSTCWEDGTDPAEDFMTMISRVANTLKNSQSIALLKKSENFRIITAEHDDSLAQSFQRILLTGSSITIKSTRTVISSH